MLISDSMQKIIRVLLNKKKIGLRNLADEADVSLGITVKITNQLQNTGYIRKGKNIVVLEFFKLLNAWAYSVSIKEIDKTEFTGAERPQYLIKKISNIANQNKLEYGFTLFSASELCCPYVAPGKTHLYIRKNQIEAWEKCLSGNNIFPGEKGNIILYLADDSFLYNKQKIDNSYLTSYPQLYIDLFSYGGRGEDAAEHLLEVFKNV
ncbi:hypothetical protein GF327_04615 [Candidatus Woesearchaeota archaeon]|nr:hypothetical protein [Candidatus Woesearchaeota archaeon]